MTQPVFDKFTVLAPLRENAQITAAVATGLDSRWDQDPYARLRTVQNGTSNTAIFNQWTVLDPQRRLNTLAGQNLTASPLATPLRRNPYAYTLPTNPPGKPVP